MWLDVVVRIVCKILRNERGALSKTKYIAYSPLLHPAKGKSRRLVKRVTDEYIQVISKSCLANKYHSNRKNTTKGTSLVLLQVFPKASLCVQMISKHSFQIKGTSLLLWIKAKITPELSPNTSWNLINNPSKNLTSDE